MLNLNLEKKKKLQKCHYRQCKFVSKSALKGTTKPWRAVFPTAVNIMIVSNSAQNHMKQLGKNPQQHPHRPPAPPSPQYFYFYI